jgi:glycerol-3-phosphate dehydrogenase
VVLIAGGKLTTYRLMAKEMVKEAVKWLKSDGALADRKLRRPRTKKRPLPGAAGLRDPSTKGVQALTKQLGDLGLDGPLAEHLAWIYGVRANQLAALIAAEPSMADPIQDDLPYVWAEIDFAVRHDLARTVDDVLSRRVPLLLVGRDQGLDVVDRVADRVGELLEWSETTRAQEVARYRRTVNDSRKFRRGQNRAASQSN